MDWRNTFRACQNFIAKKWFGKKGFFAGHSKAMGGGQPPPPPYEGNPPGKVRILLTDKLFQKNGLKIRCMLAENWFQKWFGKC